MNSKRFRAADMVETERMPFAMQKGTKRRAKGHQSQGERMPFAGLWDDACQENKDKMEVKVCHPES